MTMMKFHEVLICRKKESSRRKESGMKAILSALSKASLCPPSNVKGEDCKEIQSTNVKPPPVPTQASVPVSSHCLRGHPHYRQPGNISASLFSAALGVWESFMPPQKDISDSNGGVPFQYGLVSCDLGPLAEKIRSAYHEDGFSVFLYSTLTQIRQDYESWLCRMKGQKER